MRRLRFGVIAVLFGLGTVFAIAPLSRSQPRLDPNTDSAGNPLPGSSISCAPIAEKRQELGCYVLAHPVLGALPTGSSLAWHLDAFANLAAAEAARGQHSTVAEAFDRVGLLPIAAPDWRPTAGGEHVATVGPLPLDSVVARYAAFYLASTFRPGFSSFAHAHPGPEAWFILTGEQCLETPEGRISGRAGDGVVIRGDLPMVVRSTGSDIRRNFTLVLHDAAKPVTARVDHWKPAGLCGS